MMVTDVPATNGVSWRLTSLETRVSRMESFEPAVLAERISSHSEDMSELRDEIRSLRRALYTFALSVSLAAIVFGITVMQVVR